MKEIQPDFKNAVTPELRNFEGMIQRLIFSYDTGRSTVSSEVELLKKIWKDISNELIDRAAKEAIKSIEKEKKEQHSKEPVGTSRKLIETVPHQISIKPKITTGKPVMTILKARNINK
jgi:hypothetical protein